jgi:hypothetical protein
MNIRWQVRIVAFFGMGAIAGMAFAVAGPVLPIRLLGLFALLCGTLGAVLNAAMLRHDEPAYWTLLLQQGRMLQSVAWAKIRERLAHGTYAFRHAH